MRLPEIISLSDALNAVGGDAETLELLNERIDIIRHKLKFLENKPVVAVITSLDPLQLANGLTAEITTVAGGSPLSGAVTWEDIFLADPDIMILMPEGLTMANTLTEVVQLLSQPGFADLTAVKNNRLYIADGNQYINHPGARIVDLVEILAEIINPKQFIFGYEGDGWMKFQV